MAEDSLSDGNEITLQSFNLNDRLSNLRSSLEQLCNASLTDYTFWLQDSQQLSDDKSLIDHGIEGEGEVQIKLQVKIDENGAKMINITDVLKQTEDDEIEEVGCVSANIFSTDQRLQWVEAKDFVKEKFRYNISSDPHEWSVDDVKHWIRWAIQTFDLKNVDLDKWNVTGEYICRMTIDDFAEKVPQDVDDGDFWTHILVLQTCGQVMVRADHVPKEKFVVDSKVFPKKKLCYTTINLWRFLLELLTDKSHKNIIRWVDDNGEFQMVKPDTVARLWGEKKQKDNMTYKKLSRALRYYSEEDMISKVKGKRFVYKFHFDIEEIVGYSPMQLNKLLNDE